MKKDKVIIFDAGTLISLSMNGLIYLLKEFKKNGFSGKFIITPQVKHEVIDRPKNIKRFELEALRVESLLNEGVLEMPESLEVDMKVLEDKTKEIIEMTKSFFKSSKGEVKILHSGESSCMALAKILRDKNIESVIAVDERITRMIIEKPENLEKLLEKRLHTNIKSDKKDFSYFKDFRVIRSTEIVYVAWKKGLVNLKSSKEDKGGKRVLDALLYALKFKGCSITGDEIEKIKGMK